MHVAKFTPYLTSLYSAFTAHGGIFRGPYLGPASPMEVKQKVYTNSE